MLWWPVRYSENEKIMFWKINVWCFTLENEYVLILMNGVGKAYE